MNDLSETEQLLAYLRGELGEIDAQAGRLSARLKDEKFLSNAPGEIVDGVRDQLEGVEERRTRIAEVLARLGA